MSLRRRVTHPRHVNKLFVLFCVNIALAMIWGPILIILTLSGPAHDLSSHVVWVAIISYYANMMTNIATAAALYSSMVTNRRHNDPPA